MRALVVIALVGCVEHGKSGEVCSAMVHEWSFAVPLRSQSIRLPSGDTVVAGTFGSLDLGDGLIHNSVGPNNLYIATFDTVGVLKNLRRFVADQSLDAIVADDDGGLVVAGTFTGSIDFGGGPLTATGERDMYLARFAADGRVAFANTLPGATPVAMALTVTNDVAIVGRHDAAIDLGSGELPGPAQFLVVFDTRGDHVFDRNLAAGAESTNVAVGFVGEDIVVAGSYTFAIDLGGGPLASAGGADVYVGRLTRDGVHVASRSFGGPSDDGAQGFVGDRVGLAVSATQLVIAGSFGGTIDFGDGPHEGAGDTLKDVFVVALDPKLELRWSRAFVNPGFQAVGAIAVDADGAVAFTGISDSGTTGEPLACGGEPDDTGQRTSHMFAATIERSGVLTWSRCFAATSFAAGVFASYDAGHLALGGILDGELDVAGVALEQPVIGGFTATVQPQCE